MGDQIHIKARCRGCGKTSKLVQPMAGFDFILHALSGLHGDGKSDVSVHCPKCGDEIRLGFGRQWFERAPLQRSSQ